VDLLRLLLVYEDDLLYEPTAAEVRHGMRVVNPMPKTILVMLSATISSVSHVTATLTGVGPATSGASATLSGPQR
jgi:hypothetical protein